MVSLSWSAASTYQGEEMFAHISPGIVWQKTSQRPVARDRLPPAILLLQIAKTPQNSGKGWTFSTEAWGRGAFHVQIITDLNQSNFWEKNWLRSQKRKKS